MKSRMLILVFVFFLSCLDTLHSPVGLIVAAAADDGPKASQQSTIDYLFGELSRQKEELQKQSREIEKLKATENTKGTTYIRWGRTACSGQYSSTLYRGVTAGPRHADRGSGSNYLCLHEQPQWGKVIPGVYHWSSCIYGVEYEVLNVFSCANNGGRELQEHPAPCAVCYVSTRSAQVMIPARTECPTGWTKEYQGYIVADHWSHHRSEYICWDGAPETTTSASSQNNALVYQVEVICGSLPCSKFPSGYELPCVVCTK